ncbi:MAG: alpha-L-fucosidase [Lentisphaeria bacterium]|nr:alpha-L-fucosidase [Lentisphaeria bacterium]
MQKQFNDARKWFHEKRYGMFVHWGIYAVGGRHEQEQMRYHVPAFRYEKYAERFNPQKFDPAEWLDLFQENGMEYLVFTAKHHDGFCMWDTRETSYNIMNTPYGKDIVGMLADECHKRKFPLELYYSCVDWHHPAYPNIGRHHEIITDPAKHNFDEYIVFLKNQIRELCSNYGEIHGIWWDMNVPETEDRSINDLIRSLQPSAVINNRGYDEGDYSTPERDFQEEAGQPFSTTVEACDSICMNCWGHRNDGDYFSVRKLKRQIALYTSLGGNYLLNAGPDPEGVFPEKAVTILSQLGKWHKKVREALNAEPFLLKHSIPKVFCTVSGKNLNLILLETPSGDQLTLRDFGITPEKAVILNNGEELPFTFEKVPGNYDLREDILRIRKLPVDRMHDDLYVIQLQLTKTPVSQNIEFIQDKSGINAKE